MIDEDIKIIKRKIWWSKLLFVFYFVGICILFTIPAVILMVFIFSTPGRIALACSMALSIAILILIACKDERFVVREIGAAAVDPDDYHTLASMAEDICLATGKPFPELMLIDDRNMCNLFSIKMGRRAVIFLTLGVLKHLDSDELRAALAHEMAHIYQGDAAVNNLAISFMTATHRSWTRSAGLSPSTWMVLDILATMLYIAGLILSLIYVEYFFIFLAAVLPLFFVFAFSWCYPLFLPLIVHNRDFMADELAAKLTLQPESLIDAMRKAEFHDRGGQFAFLEWMTFVPAAEKVGRGYQRLPGVEERIDILERAFLLPPEP